MGNKVLNYHWYTVQTWRLFHYSGMLHNMAQCLLPTFSENLSFPSSSVQQSKDTWTGTLSKKGPLRCAETSLTNYWHMTSHSLIEHHDKMMCGVWRQTPVMLHFWRHRDLSDQIHKLAIVSAGKDSPGTHCQEGGSAPQRVWTLRGTENICPYRHSELGTPRYPVLHPVTCSQNYHKILDSSIGFHETWIEYCHVSFSKILSLLPGIARLNLFLTLPLPLKNHKF